MPNTFKLVSVALGFVIAAASIGSASAQTSVQTPSSLTQPTAIVPSAKTGTKMVVAKQPVHVAHRTIKHTKVARHSLKRTNIAHHSSKRLKVAHKIGLKHVAKARLVGTQRHAMNHRTGVKTSVIR